MTREDSIAAEADACWRKIKAGWNDPAPEPDPALVIALAEEYLDGDSRRLFTVRDL